MQKTKKASMSMFRCFFFRTVQGGLRGVVRHLLEIWREGKKVGRRVEDKERERRLGMEIRRRIDDLTASREDIMENASQEVNERGCLGSL